MIDGLKPYLAMKDSGIPWLGEVPEHWEVRRLGSLGAFSASGIDKKTVEGEPLVRMVNYLDIYRNATHALANDRKYMVVSCPEWKRHVHDVRSGDIVFTPSSETTEDIGCSAVAVQDIESGVYSYHVIRFRPSNPMALGFQRYWCNSAGVLAQFSAACKGTTRQILTRGDFRSIAVVVPPFAEQDGMGRFLGHADRRIRRYIRAKQKLIKLLEEQKQAIIHRAVTRGLDPNVRLKPSGVEWLGDVPEHWEVRKLGAVSTRVTKGTTPTTLGREFTDTGVRFVKVESISKDRRVRPDACSHIDTDTDVLLARSRLREGDVLVAIAGAIGRVAVVCSDDLPANCNQAVAIIRPTTRDIASDWLAIVLSSPAHQRELTDKSVQSAQANLSLGDLRAITVPLPSVREQEAIVASVVRHSATVDHARNCAAREMALLREYRTRLIADVVTGKIDVREAAARLPDEVEEPEPLDDIEAEGDTDESSAEDADEVPEEAEA